MTTSDDTAAPPTPPVGRVVLTAWPLLASILLLMTGSGLQGSLLGVRADQASFNATVTGLILGLYYLGYVAGSMWVPALIRSVGHIRVFASLASTASAAVIIHGVWVSPVPWVLLRFLTGLCIAGLFVVSESWLNDVSTPRTRATLLAIYNTVVTLGLVIGSLLLNLADTAGVVLFVVGSVMLSMAAVPVALAPHEAPVPELSSAPVTAREVFRAAPLGLTGSAMSGFGTGVALGFGAVYAVRAGFGVSGASQFVVAILVGAIVGQIPLGNWSDRTDRRVVMGTAAALIALGAGIGLVATGLESFPLVLVAALSIGAGSFSLYGLSFAHMADYVEPHKMVAAGARIITANGLGAASGPILASILIGISGPEGYFQLLIGGSVLFCLYVPYRITRRDAVESDHGHYVPVAAGTTFGGLDEIVSEASGYEASERERRRRPRMPKMPRPTRGRSGSRPPQQ